MLCLAVGCVTTKAKKTSKNKPKTKAPANAAELTIEEVTFEQPDKKFVGPPAPATKVASTSPKGLTADQIQNCERVVNQIVTPHKALFAMLPQGWYAPSGNPVDALLTLSAADCKDAAKRAPMLATIKDAVSQHSGKIGVILPLTGPRAKISEYVVNGMRAAFQEVGMNFGAMTIVKDSASNPKIAETRLAELVFRDHPSLVIGGLEQSEADVLSKRAGELLLPTLILSHDRTLASRSPLVFDVYPDEKRLADTLAAEALRRGLKRIAILKPAGGKSDKVVEYFKTAVEKGGGLVPQNLTYSAGNFDSMQGAARELFKTEAVERTDEYRAAYRKAKRKAQEEHVPFDPRMVVLKPIVDFDAVFLPDDFRMARHFSKLFQFHMVDKLVMIGNHEWRSPALVEPFDKFMEGSFFADFIAGYDKLPPAVSAPTVGSPFFVQPQNVMAVDFQLIGYRVARTARLALKTPVTTRRSIATALANLTSDNSVFFGTGKVFDAERQSAWPTYIFNVSKGELILNSFVGVGGSTQQLALKFK